MKPALLLLLLAMSLPAAAQSADAIYRQACGPKDARFDVQVAKGHPPAAPEPGKALVYFIQKEASPGFVTRIGQDGSWAGVLKGDSYITLSVAPGEHHACAASQNTKHPQAELVHFTAEAGKTYYYLVRDIAGNLGDGFFLTMALGPADRDEALYLIASDPQSVAKPKP